MNNDFHLMITLKNVSKVFKKQAVLEDISLKIKPGEFVCIVGPSGAGKSTLIHILAGAEKITTGTIEFDGVNLRIVPPLALRFFKRRIGVVFQNYRLLSKRTVAENIAYPLEVCGAPENLIKARVEGLLEKMHMKRRANALPRELSGGELARTAIARAIAHGPIVLLVDEPTGNLDPDQSLKVLKLLKQINKDGTTVVLATHDLELVKQVKGRIILIEDGKITKDAKPRASKKHETEPTPVQTKSKSKSKKVKVTALGS
ncbi:MAG: ATP-binding cassette domain-containing protein [Candidatus Peribacteraceae bacterium]|jgi:cell division transport system ATP-binding protein|nr:ATP-binding cassette domain-containing protein [Candidatus Peribacteraceae bacterium]